MLVVDFILGIVAPSFLSNMTADMMENTVLQFGNMSQDDITITRDNVLATQNITVPKNTFLSNDTVLPFFSFVSQDTFLSLNRPVHHNISESKKSIASKNHSHRPHSHHSHTHRTPASQKTHSSKNHSTVSHHGSVSQNADVSNGTSASKDGSGSHHVTPLDNMECNYILENFTHNGSAPANATEDEKILHFQLRNCPQWSCILQRLKIANDRVGKVSLPNPSTLFYVLCSDYGPQIAEHRKSIACMSTAIGMEDTVCRHWLFYRDPSGRSTILPENHPNICFHFNAYAVCTSSIHRVMCGYEAYTLAWNFKKDMQIINMNKCGVYNEG